MIFNRFIIAYMIFGCWFGQIYTPLARVGYNIWKVLIIFWIILNTLGLITMVQKSKKEDKSLEVVSPEIVLRWFGLTLLAFISFLSANEITITVLFLATCIPFMLLTSYKVERLAKKKKHK